MIKKEELKSIEISEIYCYGKMCGLVEKKYGFDTWGMHFWHWSLDHVLGEISNGSVVYVNWKQALDNAIEYDAKGLTYYPMTFTPICEAFYKEYGDKDYKVYISW